MRTVKSNTGEDHEVDDTNHLTSGILVKVDLDDIIQHDFEWFLDTISEDAGFPCLGDVSYKVEGHEENVLLIRVWGDVSTDQETEDEGCDIVALDKDVRQPASDPHPFYCRTHDHGFEAAILPHQCPIVTAPDVTTPEGPRCPYCGGRTQTLDQSSEPEGIRKDVACDHCDRIFAVTKASMVAVNTISGNALDL